MAVLLLASLVFIVFGSLLSRISFGALFVLTVLALLLGRIRQHFVDVSSLGIRVRLGYGPPIKVAYDQIDDVAEARPDLGFLGFLGTLGASLTRLTTGSEPLNEFTDIVLRRRKWVLVLAPFPFLWFTKKLRLPVVDRAAFIADVASRMGAASA